MKLNLPEKLFTAKEADPQKVRKKLLLGRSINTKTVVTIFLSAVVLIGLLSVFVIKNENDKAETTTLSETQSGETVLSEIKSEQIQSSAFNILLALTKDGNEGLQLLSVLHADPKTSEIKITYIPVDTKTDVNNYEGTMKNHLKNGGITELLWAVGQYAGISIPYYIYCDEEDFCNIMKHIGDMEITLENQINHDYNGINFIIEQGVQKLTPDMMLKYYVYLCDRESLSRKETTDLFSAIGKKLISYENPQSVTDSFDGIINSITTNISAIDVADNLSLILSFSKNESLGNITIVSSAADF